MLVFVSVNEFRNLALLPSAKIVEHYDDAAPVVELGDHRRYWCNDVNYRCMSMEYRMRNYTHREILEDLLGIHINGKGIYWQYNSNHYSWGKD